jgi:methionyl-tRNA synthetase
MPDRIHITTAIFYSNAPPHVGSAYEALAADVFARYWRRKLGASNVTFVTGTDEHGEKNQRAAADQGLSPKPFVDRIAAAFRQAFDGLGVSFDRFVRTTDPEHVKFVRAMLARAYERGEIYYRDYEGLYCVGCERFYTEKELLDGNLCPSHNRPVELIREGNYFLKIEKYRDAIRGHITETFDLIRPERYRNEALNMLAEPLEDLCISRPKARLDWGIELPFDANYVTYVWYDAFWAYLSELGCTDDAALREILPVTQHFIGKDILKTHAVYWPAMLMVAGLPMYRHLNVHGWMKFGGERMSKSSGNVRDPVTYEQALGPDVLRYFVMREVVYGLDGDFSEERLTERYNADLANDLGNFTSRVLTMTQRYLGGVLQEPPPQGSGDFLEMRNTATRGALKDLPFVVETLVKDLAFNRALEEIWRRLDVANKHIAATEPFTLAKDPANLPRVAEILLIALENLRVIAEQLEPFMPVTARKIFDLLNVDETTARKPYGEGLKPGHRVKAPIALFPRREKPAAA